jgi:hypothetical protein
MRRLPPVPLLAALFAASACAEPTESAVDAVHFSVSPSELQSGHPLITRVENRSEDSVTLHFCHLVVQRRPEGGWDSGVPDPGEPPSGLCALAPLVLLPGATDQRVAPFPRALDPGDYRLWLHVESGDADTMIASPDFHVRS